MTMIQDLPEEEKARLADKAIHKVILLCKLRHIDFALLPREFVELLFDVYSEGIRTAGEEMLVHIKRKDSVTSDVKNLAELKLPVAKQK